MTNRADVAPAWVDRLNDLLVPIVQHRIDRFGEYESGAYNFYRTRVAGGVMLCDYEIELTRELLARQLPIDRIHEIGSAFGQFLFLLGWNGFAATGFESDLRVYRTGKLLLDVLNLVDPELTRQVRLIGEAFPIDARRNFAISPTTRVAGGAFAAERELFDTANALIVATNLVHTLEPEGQLEIVRAMRRYRYALIDVDRFFVADPAAEYSERNWIFEMFATAGFSGTEPFLDLGDGGCYHLFSGAAVAVNAQQPHIDLTAVAHFAVAFLSSWIAETAARRRAAGEYYEEKLARGVLFEQYDVAIADYSSQHLPADAQFVELGSGFGELSLLLAIKGFRTIGFEHEIGRAQGGAALQAALRASGLEPARLELIEATYPEALGPEMLADGPKALATSHVSSTYMIENAEAIYRSFAGFDHLIFDVSTFGERRSEAETQALLAAIEARGFGEVASVFRADGIDVRHFARRP